MTAIALELPPEVAEVVGEVEAFVRREISTRHDTHAELLEDPRRRYGPEGGYAPEVVALIREVRMASAEAGLFNLATPQSLGGRGLGYRAYYAAWERAFHTAGGRHWLAVYALSHWAFGPSVVLEQVSERAREEILPGLLSGRELMCFGMSEPRAGSDAYALETRAERDGDGWRVNGRKIWTTNSPFADYVMVLAVTDPERQAARRGGISAFLVPMSSPGLKLARVIPMFGELGGCEGEVVFEDVPVAAHQLVGELHDGFRLGLLGVSLGRVYNSARAVGLGRWALEQAIEYARGRVVFGQPIAEYQGVTFPLTDCAMELHAAHLMGLNAAALLDRGEAAVKELSMAKAYSVQVGTRAVDQAMQAHGARGFTNELGLVDAYNAVRAVQVADGTNEILRRTVFQRLAKGDLEL